MATPTGIIGFQGTIGGITFYMRKGKPCARKAGGPSREKIATSKKCQRTRENNAEFKGAVAASKLLRTGLRFFNKNFSDGNLSWRLNGIFRNMIDRADGIRGERPVEIRSYKNLIVGFNLNTAVSFDEIFKAPFQSVTNASRNEVTLTIHQFDPGKFINAPGGATYFRLVNAITVVPKFVYDPVVKNYFRSDGLTEVLCAHSFSDFISLEESFIPAITIATALAGNPLISDESGLVSCIGIEFYQDINGEKYLLKSGSVMNVVEVF